MADIASYSEELARQAGLVNQVTSITDPAGVNIGHTVPGTIPTWTQEELSALNSGDPAVVKTTISKARRFVNGVEELEVEPGIVFTIEPRYTSFENPNLPMSSFHTMIAVHENGAVEHLTNFDNLFDLMEMNYMLEQFV